MDLGYSGLTPATPASDVLRSVEVVARSSAEPAAPLQRVTDAVAERLVEEPVDDRVDSAVRVAEPQRERQDARLAGVQVQVDAQRDHVVRQPAGDEHYHDRHQQSHDRSPAAVDRVAVGPGGRDVAGVEAGGRRR